MIRVMTFNLRTAEARDGENAWANRRDLALERIHSFAPDLLGLEEVHDAEQSADVRAALPGYTWYGVRRGGNGPAPLEMTPALVRSEAFEVLEDRVFWLSPTPDVPGSTGWGAAYARTAVQLRLRHRASGQELYWIHTHLDYLPLAVRGMSHLLREVIDDLPLLIPLMLTGDFNAGKRSLVYRTLLGRATPRRLWDALRLAQPDGRGEGTFHAFGRLPRAQAIDWILVSEGLRVLEAGIDRTAREGRFPSDHFPVWAILETP